MVIEALSDGGVRMGLTRDVATTAAAQMVQGAARMVLETGALSRRPERQGQPPGGTTIAGVLSLEDAGIRSAMARAVEEAANQAAALAAK